MSQEHNCPCAPVCVLQEALNSIGGKWKLPILCSLLANGTSRYNELLKNTHGISNTMLSKTLRELEDDGLIDRSEYIEVPIRVEYALTDKARQLQPILAQLIQWSLADKETGNHYDKEK
ncbi:MAG: helix-turn-helix transcriptional regulator [Oscillospiraceae bacterium]|nr:helix-turn-helix transcriptional regulator [Oscillospiraceae bacterium]